jgi:hypothetical protein
MSHQSIPRRGSAGRNIRENIRDAAQGRAGTAQAQLSIRAARRVIRTF